MQVTETLSEGLKRGWTVVVPKADIEGRRAKRLAELAKTVNLPGFRPGKVPMPVVKTRFGTAVMSEVLEESVNDATRTLLTERGMRAATEPKVEVVTLGDDQDLEFKIELELMPEIAMPDFAALELTRMKAEPAPEAIDKALGEIAGRQRELVEVEEARPAATGEVLTVDFLGKVDDVAFPGGTGTDMDVEIGGSGFIPGFSEQMEGMSPGETKVINVTFPEEYGAKELAGKAATFDITAKKLKTATVPAVDDELAKKLGFDTLDEVRKLIAQQIQREYDQLSRLRIKRQLLDALAKACDFPVPEGMLNAEFEQIWQRLEAERKEGRVDDDDAGKDDETLKAEYRAIAERRVRLGLLLAEIGRANSISVTADEMTRAMRAEAGRYQGQEQMVMDFFRKNPQAAESLRGPIFEEKVVDFVLELAKVAETVVTPEELAKEPEVEALAAG
ncbi:MAG: trigger factor [Acetobacteraceae bacterium SCN 69-10]|nr:trigger factor [Rhodospirillales bacterium]ODU55034.1 MAG: trigger factor [Acetobacteraceae bacterium SCN 69-10]OJY64042.1 MAG: trigger factor [Rhodospirillales bacterium 70-18]